VMARGDYGYLAEASGRTPSFVASSKVELMYGNISISWSTQTHRAMLCCNMLY
jgi:hypothetical protein